MAKPWPIDPRAPVVRERRLDLAQLLVRVAPKTRLSELSDALYEQGFCVGMIELTPSDNEGMK